MKKEVVAADAEWATVPVSGSSYSFAAAVVWVTAADADATVDVAEMTAVSGSSYFFSAAAAWATAADADVDANCLKKQGMPIGIPCFLLIVFSFEMDFLFSVFLLFLFVPF